MIFTVIKLSDIYQNWNSHIQHWVNSQRTQSVYNTFNQVTLRTNDEWNSGGCWQPTVIDMQIRNFYETYTPIGIDNITD